MASKIIRREIIETLFSPSNQNNTIIEDLSSKKSFTVRQFRSLLRAFIDSIFEEQQEQTVPDGAQQNEKLSSASSRCWNVVSLEISDIFPLALAEISCVLLNFPFLPLDPSDSSSYRSRQHDLCGVTKTIRQQEIPSLDLLLLKCREDDEKNSPSSLTQHGGEGDEDISDLRKNFVAFLDARSNRWATNNGDKNLQIPLYLIFTSGSTTNNNNNNCNVISTSSLPLPKCLVVDDENLWTYLGAISNALNIHCGNKSSRIFCLSSPTFDPSIGDIFSLFYRRSRSVKDDDDDDDVDGKSKQPTLICAAKNQILDDVTKCLNEAGRITHIITSPALWKNVDVDELNLSSVLLHGSDNEEEEEESSVLKVCLGGEAIPRSMLEKWKNFVQTTNLLTPFQKKTKKAIQLFSIYGLTEASVYQSLRPFDLFGDSTSENDLKTNLIGDPLDKNEMKMFLSVVGNNTAEDDDNASASGDISSSFEYLTGELVILSKQVVRGSIRQNSENNNFVQPFDSKNPNLLRTGDLVKIPKKYLNLESLFLDHGLLSSSHSKGSSTLLQEGNSQGNEKMYEIIFASQSPFFIEMLGRIDFQVKISGRRVSLEDIEGTVESCLCSFFVDKCIAIVNQQGTGVTGVVSMRKENNANNTNSEQSFALLEKVFRFVVNLCLRNREQLNEIAIFSSSFPVTKNGKIDRKKVKEIISSQQHDQQVRELVCHGDDDEKVPDSHLRPIVHPMRYELELLVREIWSESLGVDQKLLGHSSNFFVLGGDSLLCVKVSRETLYAIFPEEADDRTATTPKRRQRRGEFADFLRSRKKVAANEASDQKNGNSDDAGIEGTNDRDNHQNLNSTIAATALNLRVDEFGAFRGPVQPRVLLQHPTLKEYCDSLWKEICLFVGFNSASISHASASNEKSNCSFASSSSADPNILYFSELLSESIETNNEIAVSLLLDYNKILEPLQIEPIQQLGISLPSFINNNNIENKKAIAAAATSVSKSSILKKSQKPRIAFPLHHAIQKNHFELVKLLVLKFGCKATDFNLSFHVTALHAASQLPDPKILQFLVEVGQGPLQVRDSRFQTLLHYCARSGVLQTTRWLLNKCRCESNAQNETSVTEDHDASTIKKTETEVIATTSSTSVGKSNRKTLVNESTAPGGDQRTNSIGLLNSMILARDRWQRTPLHWAIVNNHFDVVKCLIEEGEVDYFPAADRSKSQLLRLTHHRTALPYETPLELAKRIQNENKMKNRSNREAENDVINDDGENDQDDEAMIQLVMKSKLN